MCEVWKLGALALLPMPAWHRIYAATQNAHQWIVSGDSFDPGTSKSSLEQIRTQEHFLFVADMKAKAHKKIRVPWPVHSIVAIPFHSSQLLCIPQRISKAFIFDVVSQKTLAELDALPNSIFYGHAAFDPSGKIFALGEQGREGLGRISFFDAKTFKRLHSISSFGYGPHELRYLNAKEILICNGEDDAGSRPSNVVRIDVAKEKATLTLAAPFAHYKLRHLEMIDSKRFVVAPLASTTSYDFIYPREPRPLYGDLEQARLELFSIPDVVAAKILDYQLLSVAIAPDRQTVSMTCPARNTITTWNLKEKKFQSYVESPSPSGLLYSPQKELLSGSSKYALRREFPILKELIPGAFLPGSHMTWIEF